MRETLTLKKSNARGVPWYNSSTITVTHNISFSERGVCECVAPSPPPPHHLPVGRGPSSPIQPGFDKDPLSHVILSLSFCPSFSLWALQLAGEKQTYRQSRGLGQGEKERCMCVCVGGGVEEIHSETTFGERFNKSKNYMESQKS